MKRYRKLIRGGIDTVGLGLLLLDFVRFRTGILAGIALVYFLADFIRYRREAVLNFRASRDLRKGMTLGKIRTIERQYSLRDDFNTFEKHALVRPPLERYFYYAKYDRVRALVLEFSAKGGRWLDLGCGFGEDMFFLSRQLSAQVVGLELDEIKLLEARRRFRGTEDFVWNDLCAGDAVRAPFKPGVFDGILITEVLEHLIEPEKGLHACQWLLKEGGLLILSTPSLHDLDYRMNPFFLAEKAISLLDERVLPPYHHLHAEREYDRKQPEAAYGTHCHFSKRGLEDLVSRNHFEVLWRGSFEIEVFPDLIMDAFSRGNISRIGTCVGPLERALEKMPVLGQLGQHLLLVARKKSG